MSVISFKVWFEFLDGTALAAEIPVWLKGSRQLLCHHPGTMKEVCLEYAKKSKAGIPIYRERPVGRLIRFPIERLLKKRNNVKVLPKSTVESRDG